MQEHMGSRIDHAFGNSSWINEWPQVKPNLYLGVTSNHASLILKLIEGETGTKPFFFKILGSGSPILMHSSYNAEILKWKDLPYIDSNRNSY